MTKIDIISGFLGAGKTTLIKKLIGEAFKDELICLIENEFGEIGIDGGFLKEAGVNITEMNSGCICCSLVGDFGEALQKVVEEYKPDRIIIEPSGVGKLSDVIKAIQNAGEQVDITLNSATTVVDVTKAKMYIKNFGEFFLNQIEACGTVVLSRTQNADEDKLLTAVNMIKEHNSEARIITTPWDEISGEIILDAMEHSSSIEDILDNFFFEEEEDEEPECCCHHHHDDDDEDEEHECCHHHHHDHDEDEEHECCHHHHHDHDEDEEHECCHHHHHDHDEDEEHECCHHHHHDHDDDEEHECCCHHDHHHHHHYDENGVCSCGHHHHDADEIFTSWGKETARKYSADELKTILDKLAVEEDNEFGFILRAKGIVPDKDGNWQEFDLVPGEYEVRQGNPDYTGKLCVIGSNLEESKIAELFGL
ncbi:MAG: GTP-binding protein [Eubacterium sp.]|nr:GTP-binding protein [Eubacterium sp.]